MLWCSHHVQCDAMSPPKYSQYCVWKVHMPLLFKSSSNCISWYSKRGLRSGRQGTMTNVCLVGSTKLITVLFDQNYRNCKRHQSGSCATTTIVCLCIQFSCPGIYCSTALYLPYNVAGCNRIPRIGPIRMSDFMTTYNTVLYRYNTDNARIPYNLKMGNPSELIYKGVVA